MQQSHIPLPKERVLFLRSQWVVVVQKVAFSWGLGTGIFVLNGCLFHRVFCPPGESVLCEPMRETKERVHREVLMS